MGKKLEYKGITLEAFTFYDEDSKTYKQESNIESLEFNGYGWGYICPHCIKKHGLYKELGVTEQSIDELINSSKHDDFICFVDGCGNKNAIEFSFEIDECKLV